MSEYRYRSIDKAGSEIGIDVRPGLPRDSIAAPNVGSEEVLDVYDDEHGQEGGVVATLVVDVE